MKKTENRLVELATAYAQNRIDIAALNKKILALTDWRLGDKVADLTEIREEYLGEGDRWRGWLHAIEIAEEFHDENCPITEGQRELAALLDQKAALRVQAGKIKRSFYAAGRSLLRVAP